MDILIKFGYRTYVFHSQEDVTKATSIYAHCIKDLDGFEMELEEKCIDFEYDSLEFEYDQKKSNPNEQE